MIMKFARLRVTPLRTYITGNYPYGKLSDFLSYRPEGYHFMPKFQSGVWDGYMRLFTKGSFPTGLLPRVLTFLEDNKVQVSYLSKYKYPEVDLRETTTELRDYQREAVLIALGHGRGVLKMPTGSGKTLCGAVLIKSLRKKALFLTHKKEILYQAYNPDAKNEDEMGVFEKEFGREFLGIIGDNKVEPNLIDVAMVQTLSRNKKKFAKHLATKRLIIVDEVHHAKSPSWYHLIQKIKAPYRYGLSATPEFGDKKMLLEAATGPIIYTAKAGKLIKEGYLSMPQIFMVKVDDEDLPDRYDYQTAYSRGVMLSEKRNALVARVTEDLITSGLAPVLVIVNKVEHGNYLVKHMPHIPFAHGQHSSKKRREYIKQLGTGELEGLIVSPIFGEGVDIPAIRSMVLAGAGKSPIKLIQEVGRGMRVEDDKTEVTIVDFYDELHSYLRKHSKKRIKVYKYAGYNVDLIEEGVIL
jgi:superfamily II DNA or RNA helicase